MSRPRALDLAVAIGGTTIRLGSESPSAIPWIEETFSAWSVGDGSTTASRWTVDVSCDPGRLAALRTRRGEHGEPRLCFAHDTLLQRLPARADESGATVLADDERDAFLVVRPGRVDLCFDDARRRGRILVVWTLLEIAATEARAELLDLHASAVASDFGGLVLMGEKGAGKTTLLLHLAAAGSARLVSNDRVLLSATPGTGVTLLGLPAPLRIRPGTLAGLPPLPPWATALDRPYLHSLAESRAATTTSRPEPLAGPAAALLGLAQVVDWLGCGIATRAPLAALVFPELRPADTGFFLDPLAPADVECRLAAHRYGAALVGREPTLFESLHRGKEHAASDLEAPVARSVPGFALHLGLDAHRDPGFASHLIDLLRTYKREDMDVRSPTTAASESDDRPRANVMHMAPEEIERFRHALGEAPEAAYTTPLVYPWSVQHFESAPRSPRARIGAGPFRLYVHVPFCRYHCTFCFYAVRTGAGDDEKARYVDALVREFEEVPPGTPLSQVFVGGGTPTALAPADLSRLFRAIFDRAPSLPGRVHTIEASPDSLTPAHLDVLQEHGVARVSMGIESLDDRVLDTVRRRHSATQALDACRLVLDRGLVLNVDLIYGLPGQTPDGFRRDIERAAAAGVSSLCLYSLRLNVHTPVATSVVPGERFDLARLVGWRRFVHRAATELGFVRTRPYFFEREGASTLPAQSPDEPLLGIGMSARSQLGDVVFRNLGRSAGYVERVDGGDSPVETLFRLGEGDLQASFVAGTLGNGRLLRRDAWDRRFGGTLDKAFGERLQALRDGGLLADDGESVRLTEDGLAVYDRVVLGFYPKSRQEALRELPPPRPAADEGVIP